MAFARGVRFCTHFRSLSATAFRPITVLPSLTQPRARRGHDTVFRVPYARAVSDCAEPTATRRRIVVSNATFKYHREPNTAFVDKTGLLAKIVSPTAPSARNAYFVNRPRKFGKTVFLDTIETYFKGDRADFKGLAIYDAEVPWEPFPVIRLTMNTFSVVDVVQFRASLCSLVSIPKRIVPIYRSLHCIFFGRFDPLPIGMA